VSNNAIYFSAAWQVTGLTVNDTITWSLYLQSLILGKIHNKSWITSTIYQLGTALPEIISMLHMLW